MISRIVTLTKYSFWFGTLLIATDPQRVTASPSPSPIGIYAILTSPVTQSDTYLATQFKIDRLIDPEADVATASKTIDRLTTAAKRFAGPNADDNTKFAAVRKVIYEPGPWNDNRPFSYDHDDPLGAQVQHKLLSTYIKTRLGNCVSMPTLFLIIAERLGLNVRFATAPLHVLVQYSTKDGHIVNIEATSGGHFARLDWYRKQLPMSDRAIASGIYMRRLSKAEGRAQMATTVLDYLFVQKRYQESIDVADAILAINPRDAYTMIKRGSAFAGLMQDEFVNQYPTPSLIPPPLRARYQMLAMQNRKAFKDAEALGWEPTE